MNTFLGSIKATDEFNDEMEIDENHHNDFDVKEQSIEREHEESLFQSNSLIENFENGSTNCFVEDYNQTNDDLDSKEDSDFEFSFRNQCDKCNKYFSRKCSLKRHKENCKGTVLPFESNNESIGMDDVASAKKVKSVEIADIKVQERSLFQCEMCNRSFNRLAKVLVLVCHLIMPSKCHLILNFSTLQRQDKRGAGGACAPRNLQALVLNIVMCPPLKFEDYLEIQCL